MLGGDILDPGLGQQDVAVLRGVGLHDLGVEHAPDLGLRRPAGDIAPVEDGCANCAVTDTPPVSGRRGTSAAAPDAARRSGGSG